MFTIFVCSRIRENDNAMEQIIVYNAIEVLENTTPVKAEWIPEKTVKDHGDGTLLVKTRKKKYIFTLELKKDLRNIHLPQLGVLKEKHDNLMVIAEVIYPNIREQLQKRQINYLDTTGNIFIQQNELMLLLNGRKADKPAKKATGRAFNKAGLKFIYYMLTEIDFLQKTYREMAEICETALGNINYIIKDLQKQGYLKKQKKKAYQLNNREVLIKTWIENYEKKLKATCLLGIFRFQQPERIKGLKTININYNKTQWGGEPAADILTNYLQPATLTLYTDEKRIDLIKNLRLIPDADGNVRIYTKFWKTTDLEKETVQPIVMYADLVNIGDPRTDELANMIYDEYLKE